MSDRDVTVGMLLLAEYERVKDEQKARIGFRDSLVYATLASMAAVIAATLNAGGRVDLLLLLPPVSVLLGWTYLVNDEKVTAARRYIHAELAPRLSALISDEEDVFAWESFHRSDPRRGVRKVLQLAVNLSMFCMAPMAALVIFWLQSAASVLLTTLSVVEGIAVAVLAVHLVIYADLQRR